MARKVQILVCVDLQGQFAVDELEQIIPHERNERKVYALTAFGAPPVQQGPNPEPIDWERIGRAVEAAVGEARGASTDAVVELFVGGQGPLPVFLHLGYAFSKFTGTQTVISRQYGGAWQAFPISTKSETVASTHLSERTGFRGDAALGTGIVAVYVDTGGRPPPVDTLRAHFVRRGETLAEVVSMRSPDAFSVTPDNSASLAQEIAKELPRIPAMYPHSGGSRFFVAGPAPLAFMVGRALNPTVERGVALTNFASKEYEFVYPLPFDDRKRREIPQDPDDIKARSRVREVVVAAVEDLQRGAHEDDLPAELAGEARGKFIHRLRELRPEIRPSDQFELSIAKATYALGDGLLEALRNADEDKQGDFARLFLLHELYHDAQGIRSTNYFDIGRAGVVLEHVDFAADVFAVRVAANMDLRQAGDSADDRAKAIAKRWMEAVVFGIECFDLHEHGARIQRLAERRLRRYLTWHLQLARAETVGKADDLRALLRTVLTAELAPLASRLDARYDKEVLDALPATEFFAAVDAKLVRAGQSGGFDPGSLVEAVRSFSRPAISKAAHFLIEEFRAILVPWRE